MPKMELKGWTGQETSKAVSWIRSAMMRREFMAYLSMLDKLKLLSAILYYNHPSRIDLPQLMMGVNFWKVLGDHNHR